MFGSPEDDEDNGWAAAGWSIHGEECSHAALRVMPEWAEVIFGSGAQFQYLHKSRVIFTVLGH